MDSLGPQENSHTLGPGSHRGHRPLPLLPSPLRVTQTAPEKGTPLAHGLPHSGMGSSPHSGWSPHSVLVLRWPWPARPAAARETCLAEADTQLPYLPSPPLPGSLLLPLPSLRLRNLLFSLPPQRRRNAITFSTSASLLGRIAFSAPSPLSHRSGELGSRFLQI